MTQPTPIVIGTDAHGLPILPHPRELYDRIMATIEPELMSIVLPTLKEKYQYEKREEKKTRALRYAKAYKQYDTAFKNALGLLHHAIKKYTHAAAASFETMTKDTERETLSDIEAAFIANNQHQSHDQ